ncbi:Glutamyl-tRNA amidotransferase subunit B [Ceraceosorus bombacis]|uniref:Glutamyl-tRNA amidotransferase subunit B n=1 Tax=Ceraceosorus bombacis TaxID=401625 RepID=A0A0P1BF55_9BASI|nr:Glutamyl-tRNA amidotransferase subunit B [Ceraceosorus bombacis]
MGSPLIEIVGMPDLKSAKEAAGYVRKVQQVLRAVGASNANMDEGSLRCDVNVSVSKRRRRSESSAYGREGQAAEEVVRGTRCEIKNLNSARFVAIAIDYEIARQISILQSGSSVSQDTMGFDEATGKTYVMRSKSDAPEYRYMPDPSLPDLILRQEDVRRIGQDAAELPGERRQRLLKRFAGCSVGEREVDVLCRMDEEVAFRRENERALRWSASGKQKEEAQAYLDPVQYFEKVVTGKEQQHGRTTEFNDADRAIDERFARDPKVKLFPHEAFGEMLDLVKQKKLTSTSARTFLRNVVDGDVRLDQVSPCCSNRIYEMLKERGMLALSASSSPDGGSVAGADGPATWQHQSESSSTQDLTLLLPILHQIIRHSPDEVRAIKSGKEKVLGKLVGLVMKATAGRADPLLVRRMLQQELMIDQQTKS